MLIDQIDETTRMALTSGALRPLKTSISTQEDGGVEFSIRVLSAIKAKQEEGNRQKSEKKHTGRDFNPFLPYDPLMYVTSFQPHHVGLLNKFPVLDRHLLIVTRHFEHQTSLLNEADFQAFYQAMAGMPGLGFYNGGQMAGASQPHKHMQLIPIPGQFPIQPLLECADSGLNGLGFPFRHYFQHFTDKSNLARDVWEGYRKGMEALRLWDQDGNQFSDYNLLCTADWLLLVPRSRENFETISVNSLGFAGALLVRNEEEAELVRKKGAMNVLVHVAYQL